jgi:CelD/BcsL family acetyltransferase involved in cellulose biosynthesis
MRPMIDAADCPIDGSSAAHVQSATAPMIQTTDFDVVVVRERAELDPFLTEIDSLACHAIESNVFYEAWMLSAALEHLGSHDVYVVLVRHRTDGITGVFPFQLQRRLRGLPMRNLSSWQHAYCFLRTPIVSSVHARATLHALLEWLESRDAPAHVVEFDLVAGDGPFWKLLCEEASALKWTTNVASFERAAFAPSANVQTGVSKKHLKELRRLERRLGERGALTYRALRIDEPIQPWVERFLALEASGWKGRGGTALSSDVRNRDFFGDVAASASARGQVQMLALELDGRPIAMKCNFVSGDSACAFKIAYDEDLAAFSPGVLLEFFNMRHLHEAHPHIRLMDSCAIPAHPMINRVWAQRRTIATSVMARRSLAASVIRHWKHLRSLRRILQWRSEPR